MVDENQWLESAFLPSAVRRRPADRYTASRILIPNALSRESPVPVRFPTSPRFWWLSVLVLAVLLRVGVMVARPEQLTTDRDLYLGIANELREGHGYSTPDTSVPMPTAFRSPLYPFLLVGTGGRPCGVAVLHLLLALGMVWATGRAVVRFGRGTDLSLPFLAGGIVALDPLLLLYSGQPMTETLCSCLSAVLLWRMATSEDTTRGAMIEGVVWGLCLLARPTYAVALGLCLLGRLLLNTSPKRERGSPMWAPRLRFGLVIVVTALAVVSPWAIRNGMVFGKPIVTTTHGGYTLWLANNPVYYAEVIEGGAPAWDGESLRRWQQETNSEMERLEIHGEIARDQWQATRAKQFIRENPWRFVRACRHRAVTFWSIFPGRSAETGLPVPMLWIIAAGYAAVWVGGVVALGRLWSQGQFSNVWPVLSLILGFVLVHLVYWTDVRMRAPIMPAVAVLVAVGWRRQTSSTPEKQSASRESGPLSPAIDVNMAHRRDCGGEGAEMASVHLLPIRLLRHASADPNFTHVPFW